jgi:hypothetical protein
MKKNRKKYMPPEEEYTPQSLKDFYIEVHGSAEGYEAVWVRFEEQMRLLAEIVGFHRPKPKKNRRR